ncbi:hypothetical protein [Clostridium algifaecis]|uniref:hypothetical protein n=1 Tax=Clostridium algifaecis TaxID=1472040 RepID=UPI001AE1DE45|nr:hypothetical protein [Clostridium algifaecis]
MSIIKKNFIATCILCIISILVGVGCSNKTANYEPTFKNIGLKTDSTKVKEISYQIMKEYLNEYKKDTVSKKVKITDYTINGIYNIKGNTDKFSFSVDYSVKPSEKPSDENSGWLAGTGDGVLKGDWVIDKDEFIYVNKVNNEYKITSIGTGP